MLLKKGKLVLTCCLNLLYTSIYYIREVEERITFLVQSLKTQVQNTTPQYHQQDAVMQKYQHQPHQMDNMHSSNGFKNSKEVPKKNRRSKKLKIH